MTKDHVQVNAARSRVSPKPYGGMPIQRKTIERQATLKDPELEEGQVCNARSNGPETLATGVPHFAGLGRVDQSIRSAATQPIQDRLDAPSVHR